MLILYFTHATAATWIEVDPESNEEMVRGFAKIEKARWKLVRPVPDVLLRAKVSDALLPPAEMPALHRVARHQGCVLSRSSRLRSSRADSRSPLPLAVQCTKGKCIKAFHVTCALREGSGIHLDATIPDVDGSGGAISILDQTRAATPPPAVVDGQGQGAQPVQPAQLAQSEPAPAPAAAEPPVSPSKASPANEQIHLTILCRTHNPVRLLSTSNCFAASS